MAQQLSSVSQSIAGEQTTAAHNIQVLQEQIAALRDEKDNLVGRLDEKAESAEKLMVFVREVEENRKLVENEFRTKNEELVSHNNELQTRVAKL
jgi:hypothetical protein